MKRSDRQQIEQAEEERAIAVNQAIYWRRACTDVRAVCEARGAALRAALAHPGAFDAAMLALTGRTPEVVQMARDELQMYRPGGWIDQGKEQDE